MRRISIAAAVLMAGSLSLLAPAFSATALPTDQFVQTVAASDIFEIESGRLAAERAKLEALQSFGQRMVDDHSKTTKELKALVTDNNINAQLPSALDQNQQAKLDKLKGLSENEFDRSYINSQVEAHRQAVDLFQDYSQGGDNANLKEWTKNTLPALKDHLQEAQTLQKQVDKPAATAASDNKPETRDAEQSGHATHKKSINYLTRQAPKDWTAEALIGRTVENGNGDDLGEINNVVINENGNVVAVVIGVGGFLGIGEKDVGVPFDVLDFRTDAQMDRSDSASTADRAEKRADDRSARFDTEHDNMRIVLMTSKEDLEGAPDYAWLDEQNAGAAPRDNTTTAKTEADCVAAKGVWDAATTTCAQKKM